MRVIRQTSATPPGGPGRSLMMTRSGRLGEGCECCNAPKRGPSHIISRHFPTLAHRRTISASGPNHSAPRQPRREGRAVVGVGRDVERAAVAQDDLVRDVETKAEADGTRPGTASSERFEQNG